MIPLILALVTIAQADGRPAGAEALGPVYVDGSEGFSIRPPAGWQLDRRRTPEESETIVLRMQGPGMAGEGQEIIVKQVPLLRRRTMEETLQQRAAALGVEFSGLKVLSQQSQELAGRPGGLVSMTYEREAIRWLRLEAWVLAGPQQLLSLQYTAPEEMRGQSEALFPSVTASLRLLPEYLKPPALREALAAGMELIGRCDEAALRRAIVPEQHFQVFIDGRPVGFVSLLEQPLAWKGHPGLRIRERGWVFEADGSCQRVQRNLYLSFDLEHEEWRSSESTLAPASAERPALLHAFLDEGLRTKDVLLSTQSYQLGQPSVQNAPLRLPPSYLSRALVRMLPRLAGELSKPRKLAFTTFDHQRADLVVRIVEFKGESTLPSGASVGKVHRIEEREGLAGEPSQVYVDSSGRVLMLEAGPLKMERAKREGVQKMFADRIGPAEQEMERLEKEYEEAESRFGRSQP